MQHIAIVERIPELELLAKLRLLTLRITTTRIGV
jgi:hypothetical protein